MQKEIEHPHTRPHPPEASPPKNTTQGISLVVGFVLFVLGLAGMLSPSFAGLHLSIPHSLIISATGAMLFYNGYTDNSWNAFLCCLGFGLFFGTYSILGFVLGEPGTPTVGYQGFDPFLVKVIPRVQEFGRADHVLNGVIALILLGGAMDWARMHKEKVVSKKGRPPVRHYHRRQSV